MFHLFYLGTKGSELLCLDDKDIERSVTPEELSQHGRFSKSGFQKSSPLSQLYLSPR